MPAIPKTSTPIVLLGGQRFEPTVRFVADRLGLDGPVALVTAGWQERETEDGELTEHLARETINLCLYERTEAILRADAPLREAHAARQEVLRRRQTFYRIRLEHLLEAGDAIRSRSAAPEVLALEEATSDAALRALDAAHLDACVQARAEFNRVHRPLERPAVARHRAELQELLAGVSAVAIAGGHVGVLLSRLHLLGFGSLITNPDLHGLPLLAWSAGAMVLTRRVVLYHDHPPQGRGASQVLDEGLGLVRDVIVLPEPELRLAAEDSDRISVAARRFTPDRCLAFPARSHLILRDHRLEEAEGVLLLRDDGSVTALDEGSAW